MDIPIIMPQALTFLTTFRCSAACENCCFQCNPKFKKKMTVVDMKRYLDKSFRENCREKNGCRLWSCCHCYCSLDKNILRNVILFNLSKNLYYE